MEYFGTSYLRRLYSLSNLLFVHDTMASLSAEINTSSIYNDGLIKLLLNVGDCKQL